MRSLNGKSVAMQKLQTLTSAAARTATRVIAGNARITTCSILVADEDACHKKKPASEAGFSNAVICSDLLSSHRFFEVVTNAVDELFCCQPALIRTDEKREVFRHVASFNCLDDGFFKQLREV